MNADRQEPSGPIRDSEARERLDRMEEHLMRHDRRLAQSLHLSELETFENEMRSRLLRLEESVLNDSIVSREIVHGLSRVENHCENLQQQIETQKCRIAELESELWRTRRSAVGTEHQLSTLIDSVRTSTMRDLDSQREEISRLKLKIEDIRHSKSILCEFCSDRTMDGIIRYLTTQYGEQVIDVKSKSIAENGSSDSFEAIDPQTKYISSFDSPNFFISENFPDQWICYDLKDRRVICTHYSIRTHPSEGISGLHHPRNWVIEGSIDSEHWIILAEERDNDSLQECNTMKSFQIENQESVCQIRLRQTGLNQGGDYCLALSGFEIYGTIMDC
jgi:hypothetical protein